MGSLIAQVAVFAFICHFQWISVTAQTFALYTPKSLAAQYLTMNSEAMGFDPKFPTRILFQDTDENPSIDIHLLFWKHYARLGYYNIIVVGYPAGQLNIALLSEAIGQFIYNMKEVHHLELNSTVLIATGYGVSIAGRAGRWINLQGNQTIRAIFAMGPPTNSKGVYRDGVYQLRADDAQKVVVFHTNSNHPKFTQERLGRLDIYITPDCSYLDCSKNTAFGYFMNMTAYNVQGLYRDVFEKKCRLLPHIIVEAPSEMDLLNLCGAYKIISTRPQLQEGTNVFGRNLPLIQRHWGNFCMIRNGTEFGVIGLKNF